VKPWLSDEKMILIITLKNKNTTLSDNKQQNHLILSNKVIFYK
jgi:hypothetical protein